MWIELVSEKGKKHLLLDWVQETIVVAIGVQKSRWISRKRVGKSLEDQKIVTIIVERRNPKQKS